jgi:hypothetical protein
MSGPTKPSRVGNEENVAAQYRAPGRIKRARFFGLAALSIVLAANAFGADPVRDVAATLGALRGVFVDDASGFATQVPPVARTLMANAKAELRELASTLLRDQPADAKAAATHLGTALHDALNAGRALEECDSQYGTLFPPEVTAPAGDLVAVKVVLAIPCGGDASLFLFRHEDGHWRLVLDRERNDYEEVSGGAGDFLFRVSSPDARGSFLVIAADISPWCSSNWQSLRYDELRHYPPMRCICNRLKGAVECAFIGNVGASRALSRAARVVLSQLGSSV